MQLQPGVLVIAGILSLALISLPLGLPLWGRHEEGRKGHDEGR